MTSGIPFGHFLLHRRLARGGMAEVFLARQSGLEGFDRRVAVKRILPHLSERADFVKMFLDEARLAARLSHPNIAHIYEFGKVDEDYFIAMEYVEGVHAGQLIKRPEDRLPPVLVARIGADAASALAYAHRLEDVDGSPLHVVHRDISPPNLLISFDGVVKLVDFGIAKAAALGGDQTQPGVVKGKYAYMSPEQTTGRPLDGRSDVFSLALVLWELLAGRHVVHRGDPVEAMRAIRDGRFPAIEDVMPEVPAPLAAAIGSALEVDREERATAAELGVALEAFIKASPDLATAMHLAEWIRERFARPAPTQSHPALPAIDAAPRGTRPMTHATAVATLAPTPSPVALPPREATILHTAIPPSGESIELSDVPDALVDDGDVTDAVATLGARGRPPTHLDDDPHTAILGHAPSPPPRRRSPLLWAIPAIAAVLGVSALIVTTNSDSTPARPERDREAVESKDAGGTTVVAITPDAAPPIDAAAPTPRDDAAAFASLDVITQPAGATVRIGGRGAPQRSPASFLDLPPGDTTIKVDLDGYEPLTRELTLRAGERRTLDLELQRKARVTHVDKKPAPGTLNVRTDPYSVVYDGKKKLGETPFVRELPAGNYTLRFVNPDRPPQTRKVTITAGKTTKLRFSL